MDTESVRMSEGENRYPFTAVSAAGILLNGWPFQKRAGCLKSPAKISQQPGFWLECCKFLVKYISSSIAFYKSKDCWDFLEFPEGCGGLYIERKFR